VNDGCNYQNIAIVLLLFAIDSESCPIMEIIIILEGKRFIPIHKRESLTGKTKTTPAAIIAIV
jgi:hypothetical protein